MKQNRILKYTSLVVLGAPLFFLLVIIFLVRFTNLTWHLSEKKTFIGYDEHTNEWVVNGWETKHLNGKDGPYFFCKENNCKVYKVAKIGADFNVIKDFKPKKELKNLLVEVENEDRDTFRIDLRAQYLKDSSVFEMPSKIMALSDIEGNFNAFSNLLIQSGVINNNHNWNFENGHLVLVGDFMDRGKNVTAVLWLIYKLEQEAEKKGGKVHFVLGNHEIMNLNYEAYYAQSKYKAFAQKISGISKYNDAYAVFMSNENELVKWLKSKNIILKLGEYLFVHGGISSDFINEFSPSIEAINTVFHKRILDRNFQQTAFSRSIFGNKGPFWYRGNVMDYKEMYLKENEKDFQSILTHFKVKKIVIGHTVVESISSDYQGKLIRLDVKHGKGKNSSLSECVLIENNKTLIINGLGEKKGID